jgi:exoribonuclease R
MSPLKEWQLWRQLRGAFKISRFVFVPVMDYMEDYKIDQFDTMEEALASCEGERAFLEPTGYKTMGELPQGDIVLICGNTAEHNMEHANVDETYQIHTEGSTAHNHLYGSNAAAIALAIRYGQ